MYHCSKCNAPLTQFDIDFHHNRFPNKSLLECECFHCATQKGKYIKDFQLGCEKPKHLWAHIVPLVAFVGLLSYLSSVAAPEDWYLAIILFFSPLGLLAGEPIAMLPAICLCICGFIVTAGIFKPMSSQANVSREREYVWEGTLSSDGKKVTFEKVEKSDPGEFNVLVAKLFCFLTFSIWFLPHLIYLLFKRQRSQGILLKHYSRKDLKAYCKVHKNYIQRNKKQKKGNSSF